MTDDIDLRADGDGALSEQGLDPLLDFIHRSRGFDFTGYKRSSLGRRIRRRMQLVGLDSFASYLDHLEVHPDEFPQLFNMLLINVTAFFRDTAAWDALANRLPAIIDLKGAGPVRVWSAGCSSGEEPYTLAMLLCEALGAEAFARRVKIYATDVDEDALAHGRQAAYSQQSLETVPPGLVEKYFVRVGSNFVFQKDLRRAVIFGRHDLVQDAPIPRVDVLSCRNSLMYFNAETQTRILQRLQFALNPGGVLLLGKAEMLLTHADMFTPVDLKLRLFARATKVHRPRDRAAVDMKTSAVGTAGEGGRTQLQDAAFAACPLAQITIDPAGRVAIVNARAAQLFAVPSSDVGRPFHELELSYRPAELRSCIDRVRLERRATHLKEVERTAAGGEKTYLDVDVEPLLSESGAFLGAQVSFVDITTAYRLQQELRRSNTELEAAQQELQSASEELETTNEELQSTVEELETTNEELQSTNEELETMNEELQSTNEELQTMNEELRQRGTELKQLNAFHDAVLGSLRSGVAVLDAELHVRTWNAKMEDLWGMRSEEVEGKHFLNLDFGLPLEVLTPSLRACLATNEKGAEVDPIECTNRKGRKVTCRVSVLPVRGDGIEGVVVLVDEVAA